MSIPATEISEKQMAIIIKRLGKGHAPRVIAKAMGLHPAVIRAAKGGSPKVQIRDAET